MNLEELRAVQRGERETDSLQPLRDSFYRDVAEYMNGLREERARAAERADDPFGSEEVRHLTDEIETAQEVAEAVYDRRLGKVVKRASLAAAGMSTDEEGLTDEEADLFETVVDQIESRRGAVLSAFAGEAETPSPDSGDTPEDTPDPGPTGTDEPSTSDTSDADRQPLQDPDQAREDAGGRVDPDPAGVPGSAPENGTVAPDEHPLGNAGGQDAGFDASDAMNGAGTSREGANQDTDDRSGETEAESPGAEGATPDGGQFTADRTTVRIVEDVGEVLGVDGSAYDLADGDVVRLPSTNAEPLLERDAASRIE